MAAPGIDELREGLAVNLSTIANTQVSAWLLGNPTPPYIEIDLGWRHDGTVGIDYDRTFQRGLDSLTFTVRALVGAASDIGAQKRLMRFIAPTGSESVKAAVESDVTLGGVADDLRVVSFIGPFTFPRDGGAPLYGGDWRVEVWADGR